MQSQQDPTTTSRSRRGIGIAVAAALLVAGGGVVALGAAMGFGDACTFTPGALHCPNGEVSYASYWTLLALPPLGLLAALLVGGIGGGIALRRSRTGLRWAGAAWAVFALYFLITIIVGHFVMW
ncbi:hypothetical protein [Saccharopolyspora mangrovi]|uniref:Integral membrane protein n=1 Tax=Saccharopolyspora mangrovi TaxID=3082379 RepID=A0ABU6AEG5_9PSEU|nr:hypothetical protein [Saccharopolyspora sp. S2-29]MEB3369868.1 hypothetical protein [Saccharopolyspora sp. S2-29]